MQSKLFLHRKTQKNLFRLFELRFFAQRHHDRSPNSAIHRNLKPLWFLFHQVDPFFFFFFGSLKIPLWNKPSHQIQIVWITPPLRDIHFKCPREFGVLHQAQSIRIFKEISLPGTNPCLKETLWPKQLFIVLGILWTPYPESFCLEVKSLQKNCLPLLKHFLQRPAHWSRFFLLFSFSSFRETILIIIFLILNMFNPDG